MKPVTKKSLSTFLSLTLSGILAVGGVPTPALAEMAEEAMTEEVQTNATKPQEQSTEQPKDQPQGQPEEQELGTDDGTVNVEPQAQEPQPQGPQVQDPQAQEPQLEVQGDQPFEMITVEDEPVTLAMEGGQSNEELLNGYVQQKLDEPLEQSAGVQLGIQSAEDGLTGNDLRMYQLLKQKVSDVAAGEQQSTVFTFTPEDLLGKGNTGPFSAADLGVSSVFVGNSYNQDALNKMRAKIKGDYGKVWKALLADCPYDFYWHDKCYYDAGANIYPFRQQLSGIKAVRSGGEYKLAFDGDITITLLAAKEYSLTGRQGTTEVNKTLIKQTNGVVDKAVKKARSIVNDNNNKSNLEKLKAYKEAICAEVSYNHDAADDDSTPYGNPWQLIWAFDGDSSTTVVCEGYSKAFKYLCDLTWPGENPEVECLLVTGTMYGGTGSGAHMWNIVRMDDNKNYLVDVTNCDTGSIGATDKLFMKSRQGGSYASGYSFPLSQTMTYEYDSDTKNAFGEDALTLSETAYTGPAEKIRVSVPVAQTGLLYNRSSQTGVSAGTGYKVQNGSAVNAGKYTATATLESGYMWDDGTTEPKQIPWSIARRQVWLVWTTGSFTYDGKSHCPTVSVEGAYSADKVTVTVDGAQTDAGSHVARVTAISNDNYSLPTGRSTNFDITPASLTDVTLETGSFVHDGTAKKPAVSSVKAGSLDVPSSGYTVSYANNVNVGTGKVTVTGRGNFAGSVIKTFQIVDASINTATIDKIPEQTYTGSAISPTPTVKVGSKTLTVGTDYTVSYANNVNVGTAIVTIQGKGSYAGTKQISFKINPAQLTAVTLATTNFTYDGGEKKPAVSSVKAGSLTVPAAGYTVSYSGNVNAGTATATVTGRGNYEGTATAEFTIKRAASAVTKAPAAKALTYSDGAQALVTPGTASGGTMLYSLNNGTWTATVPTATNAGTYYIRYKVQGDSNHNDGAVSGPVTARIAKAANSLAASSSASVEKNGVTDLSRFVSGGNGAVTYRITQGLSGCSVTESGSFTAGGVAGTCVVTVSAAGDANHEAANATMQLSVRPGMDDTVMTFSGGSGDSVYDGSAKRPAVRLVMGGRTLSEGADYTLEYLNNVDAGIATVRATGKGQFTGTEELTFRISRAQLTAVTLATTNFTYDGGEKTPSVSSVRAGSLTVPAAGYTVSYSGNVNAGTATATVTGRGNYEGTATAGFTIAKAASVMTKAPAAKVLTYSGWAQTLVTPGTASGGTMLYSLNNGTWTATAPTATNAGTYSVRYKVQGDSNHNNIEGASPVSVTIQKATIKPTVTIEGWTYGTEAARPQTSANPGNGRVTYTYGKASAPVDQYTTIVPTNAGSYVVRAVVAETDNYQSGVATDTFSIAKANNSLQVHSPVAVTKGGRTNLSAYVTGGNGPVTYTINGWGLAGCSVGAQDGSFVAGTTDGTCEVKVSAAGDDNHNAGEKTIIVQVANKPSLRTAEVTPAVGSYTYDGKAKTPAVTVRLDGRTLVAGVDYDVSYKKNVDVGTATVTVTGKGNYTESASGTFRINPAAISAAAMTVSPASYTYDGKAKIPGVTAKFNGTTLVANRDFTVAFANNVNAGTATATITGKGNFTGKKSTTFRINPAQITSVAVSPNSFTYDGKAKTPGVTVKAGGITVPGSGYTLSYKNNVNAGTATVTVTGKGNFSGGRNATFKINPAQVTSVAVSPNSFTYDGKAKTPGVTVKAGGITVPASGYTVRYANNVNVGTATATATGKGNFAGSKSATFTIAAAPKPSTPASPATPVVTPVAHVTYQTHVQNIGDQGWRHDGAEAGTHGMSYRLEAIRLKLDGAHLPGSIEYRTHVQNIGWQDYRRDGAEAGTHGMSYRLEAIQIRLTGEMAKRYDVWYCVHAQDIGDMGWAKNDAPAGTAGFSRRLEAIRVVILPKGSPAPGRQHEAFVSRDGSTPDQSFSGHAVRSRTHVQDIGWQGWATDGQMSGTQGMSKRLEGIEIVLCDKPSAGGIEYRTHVQNIGWQGYVRDGQMSGTSGRSLRLEAIQIRLTGAMALTHDVWYRVHAQEFGWMGWARNDQQAGTAGFAYRLEGIEILVLPKGSPAPGSTAGAFRQR